MILGLELTLFLYVLLASTYWILRILNTNAAIISLIACNSFLLLAANPVLSVYLGVQIALVVVLYVFCRKFPRRASSLCWLTFAGLFPTNAHVWFGPDWTFIQPLAGDLDRLAMTNVFWTMGVSFFVIKSFVILKESIAAGRVSAVPALAGLTFIPAFSAGPIHGTAVWSKANLANAITAEVAANILMRIGWGAAALYVIAPALRDASVAVQAFEFGVIAQIYLRFAALFFDFSGYTILAIACGKMFGVELPENFNRPYLAMSIRDFWKRWHMSLSWFISTYLFKPFVRHTGSARKGIFLAFLFAGLWHEVSIGYLLWGVGHGAALATAMKPPSIWRRTMDRLPRRAVMAIGWFATMTWVATLSHIAFVLGA